MVEKLADKVITQMEKAGYTDRDEREYYIYSFITLVEKMITLATIICISYLFDKFVPTLFFVICFFSLRKRTGGYHAPKFWQCYIATTATTIILDVTCHFFIKYMDIVYGAVVVSAIIIVIIGTVNHPNMVMDKEELQESKTAARYVLGLCCVFIISCICLNANVICIFYMCAAIILCAVFMCVAKIIRQEL